jgi:group I intron endonuclease
LAGIAYLSNRVKDKNTKKQNTNEQNTYKNTVTFTDKNTVTFTVTDKSKVKDTDKFTGKNKGNKGNKEYESKVYYKLDSIKVQKKIKDDNLLRVGIYILKNEINNKRYIDSSENLTRDLKGYFNMDTLFRKSQDGKRFVINKAILKHGLSNFVLEVIYCNSKDLYKITRDKLREFRPGYNINLKYLEETSNSTKHLAKVKPFVEPVKLAEVKPVEVKPVEDKPETKGFTVINLDQLSLVSFELKQLSLIKYEEKQLLLIKYETKQLSLIKPDTKLLSLIKENKRVISKETKLKMSLAQSKRIKHPVEGFRIEVHDLVEGSTRTYLSYREASRDLNISVSVISRRIKLNIDKTYKGRYTFIKIKEIKCINVLN